MNPVQPISKERFAILHNQPFNIPKKSVYLDIMDKMLKDMEQGLAFYRHIKAKGQDQYDFGLEA
ncbi:hypothetical protein DU508_13665 [Pedobacter chinensis]|uniref:Uncharacterized protein n=1 Tax=Pedobacter chinensis TaxID=2282421 RepID=A0A369PUF3_9SPHI|nr:hypothetical protein DU508_13665 [Pedobacter chinensis]